MSGKAMHDPDECRTKFASALSDMYRQEVPQYGTLLDIVARVDHELGSRLSQTAQHRIEVERHGAVRLGTAGELAIMRRMFAVMGMHAVSYYDLSVAGLPVHATCFRPLTAASLERNPFRVFTSLLRLELIQDPAVRCKARDLLEKRRIFTPRCVELIRKAESNQGLSDADGDEYVRESLETFRWHKHSTVDPQTYQALQAEHALVADVVCFKGPHINHLTPRTFDIETTQIEMERCGLRVKSVIEGPPAMQCPILLRQTSFLALEESIIFSRDRREVPGKHKARFGEIEQRGVALTPKGRRPYDALTARVREASGHSSLASVFKEFPGDADTLRREGLAYFKYTVATRSPVPAPNPDIDMLVDSKTLAFEPITYEHFLPVSAAGIFNSNLADSDVARCAVGGDQPTFELALGCKVRDEFELYSEVQNASIARCLEELAHTQRDDEKRVCNPISV